MGEIRIKGTCESMTPEAVVKLNPLARDYLVGDLSEIQVNPPVQAPIPAPKPFTGFQVTY